MSGKLFAFNVSKKIEIMDEQVRDQLEKGPRASLVTALGFCSSGQRYGVAICSIDVIGCHTQGRAGIYICDITRYD